MWRDENVLAVSPRRQIDRDKGATRKKKAPETKPTG